MHCGAFCIIPEGAIGYYLGFTIVECKLPNRIICHFGCHGYSLEWQKSTIVNYNHRMTMTIVNRGHWLTITSMGFAIPDHVNDLVATL